jgi:hypothetical protein
MDHNHQRKHFVKILFLEAQIATAVHGLCDDRLQDDVYVEGHMNVVLGPPRQNCWSPS